MRNQPTVSQFAGRPLNTLAQSGTKIISKPVKPSIIVGGNGTELSSFQNESGRTKKKLITSKLMLSLVDVSKRKGNPERTKTYWNTFHCQNRVYSSDGKLYGKYCKNRFCTTCCSIRKAEIIHKYLPVIQTWEEPYFVTLTSKSVPAHKLEKRMSDILRGFRIIKEKYKKPHQRGKSIKLMGIKSLECNFNPIARTYNPHLHLIVPNKAVADILVSEWLTLCTKDFALSFAQDSRKVENLEMALIEIIKYSSKIFTDPEMTKKNKPGDKVKNKLKVKPYIYVSALDNIIWAMKGHRIFERFGFNLPESKKDKESKSTQINEYKQWNYDLSQFNWIDQESEDRLSDYSPSDELTCLLESYINNTLE